MKAKLSQWKASQLSIAGRHILVQSVTSTLANHAMQCVKIPAGVCDAIDQIQRNFLWGGTNENRKPALVKWSTVCTPKNQGGLGIRDSRSMNKALLAKRGWQLCSNNDALWVRIIKAKYLNRDSFLQVEPKSDASFTWKSFLDARDVVEHGIAFLVRNGRIIRFWLDTWLGDEPLISKASTNITEQEANSTVIQYWTDTGWDLDRLRNKLPQDVLFLLTSFIIDPNSTDNDIAYWKHNANGNFTTNSAYMSLM